ncbi:LOW QUALITY PROTEIN: hypothetical protein RJ639_040616 [Escallonia herrerae]|uniref:Helicase ATP-binding domain-containing protein n=1 Tax=Escallonia herrerae TaxID=1293975 RepID=A0AA88WMD8_9ASTE|nr:LOW QUALITY PROTEIN: hypothetical protein RJ639_040616 [Escallonia herrerae]
MGGMVMLVDESIGKDGVVFSMDTVVWGDVILRKGISFPCLSFGGLAEVNLQRMALTVSVVQSCSMVSVFMGHDGLHLFDNGRVPKDTDINSDDAICSFDASLACKRFPSIILGRSPGVELYDGTTNHPANSGLIAGEIFKKVLSNSIGSKCIDQDSLCETWSSVNSAGNPNSSSSRGENSLPSCAESQAIQTEEKSGFDSSCKTWGSVAKNLRREKCSSLVEESHHGLPLCAGSSSLGTEAKQNLEVTLEELPSISALEAQENSASVELILDNSISHLLELTKRKCSQLEDSGFFTLRKLLHHFPRTYANLQNAQIGIDYGQYLIFVGEIMSSRGIQASRSLSFLEVVVGCTPDSTSEHTEEHDNISRRTIYLHLKKFFRGTRFTCQPFLRSLQEKHKEGDIVCVSGKVKTMRSKDHYEIREYNMDVIQDEHDSFARASGRPYPIYPSKGALNPNFIRDIITRVLQALPINIDPIPEDITDGFGLLSLYNAYFGIHKPQSLTEADSARKRLIFDEFFYLQLARLFQMLGGLDTQIERDGLLDKYRKTDVNAIFVEEWCSLTKKLLKALPYSLTSSQITAVSEIIWDLKRQVDVGCGKTVVSFLACMEVIGSGYQAAFMVPTELLAVQHYEHLLKLLETMEDVDCKPSVALLTGSTPSKQVYWLETSHWSLVHSLIADKEDFSALRIAVIDEQHRFGVIQRGRFNSKLYFNSVCSRLVESDSGGSLKDDVHMAPHVLAMSATPIPRTLALALYGDMSLTQITDLPPGRIPVETHVIEGNEVGFEKVYQVSLFFI